MMDFLQEHAVRFYWLLGVTIPAFGFYVLIDKGSKRMKRKINSDYFSLITLVSRILKVFIVLFVLLFLTFYLVDKSYYAFITDNLKTVTWLTAVAIFTIVSTSISNTLFNGIIRKKTEDKGNPTSFKFLKYVSVFCITIFGIVLAAFAFPSLTGLAQTTVGGAGILALIIGVASQEALANLVGGFFIIIFKPFQLHDIIKISDGIIGEVKDITLRHTVIRTFENKMVVIPNAIINKEKIINYNLGDPKHCQWIEIGISYSSSIDLAKQIIREECEVHPYLIDTRTEVEKQNTEKVIIRVTGLEDSAVLLRASAWAKDFSNAFALKCDVYESVKKRFDKEGVEIPFPHRTLVFKDEQVNKFSQQREPILT